MMPLRMLIFADHVWCTQFMNVESGDISLPVDGHVVQRDCSMSMARANLIAVALLPVAAIVSLGPFLLIHGWSAVAAGWRVLTSPLWFFTTWFVVSVLVHEALHGLGFRLGGGAGAVRYGFNVRSVTPYATCTVPLEVRAYRLAAALPALVLGVVPFLAALLTGVGWLAIFAFFMLITALGDAMILWMVRGAPAGTFVADHPSRAGCVLLENSVSSAVPRTDDHLVDA